MPPSFGHLVILSLLPSAVFSLTCYVCATGGLSEFGECKEQFQYDCTPYASKFPGERTYCRTTREKNQNGTFSVMKECISETDHYSRFPEKGYPLDEECDLVDVQGQEVAYCVCRQPLCNREPVADQFMAFEEKHPELFGDVEDNSTPSRPNIPSGMAPLAIPAEKKPSAAFAAPQIVPPVIVPVNDPRVFGSPPGSSSEIRRQPTQNSRPQLPSRDLSPINSGVVSLSGISPVRQSGFVGTVGRDPSPTVASISSSANVAPPVPAPPVIPDHLPAVVPVVAQPSRPIPSKPALQCYQCGERGLSDVTSDCSQQSLLECTQPDQICFTRMLTLAPGKYAVEKMCVSPENIKAMFGDGAVKGECGIASQGNEHYCSCTSSECNRLPLHDQRSLRSPVPLPPSNPQVPEPIKKPEQLQPVKEISEPIKSPEIKVPPQVHPPPPPVLSPPKIEEKLQPIVPVITAPRKKAELRCSFCQEEGITDPTADCQASATRDCRDGQTMCLTQQIQLEADFRMEKRCVSMEEFSNIIEGEPFEEGCATADEGMTNYCLCKEDRCNSGSLLNQAQLSGVRDALEQGRHGSHSQNKVEEEVEEEEEELSRVPARVPVKQPVVNGAPIQRVEMPKKSAEDAELELRRQQWAEADSSSSSLSLLLSLLLLVLVL